MKKSQGKCWKLAACSLATALLFSTVGCQVDINGQTLPSPYYRYDDVQYFAPGTEYPLSAEAASLEAAKADMQRQQAGQ